MDELEQEPDSLLEELMHYGWAEWEESEDEKDVYKYEREDEIEYVTDQKDDEENSEGSDTDFGAVQVQKREASFLRRKAEKNTDAFRKLLAGSKNEKQTDSVETIITLEDGPRTPSPDSRSSSESYSSSEGIDANDSQLELSNIFNAFSIPDDPGNVRAFWVLYDPIPVYTNDGIQKFADTMKASNLRPIACMSDLLRSDLINLRYYGLNPRAVKAICEATYNNTSVQSLDLKGNWLTPDACLHLNNLLSESEILTSVNLSGCNIGHEGVENMLPGIARSRSLVELDLSNCHLGNEGLNVLAPIIESNQLLQTLSLSDNHLGTECAQALEAMLARNTSLLHLNLSWNGLFTKEASNGLFKGLLQNVTLVSIDLSWNALSKESLAPLGAFLQKNQTLVTLNLSGNRFDEQAGSAMEKSLAKNSGLREFYIGDNPLRSAGALALIHALMPDKSPQSKLRYVDLKNVWVNKEVLSDLERIKTDRPWLQVKLGGIFSNYKLVGPDVQKIIFKRAIFEGMKPKKKKQRKDFGHFILSLEDKLNTRENFKQLVKEFKIKLSDTLVHALMSAFLGANKKVDQTAMKARYLQEYSNTTAPPPPLAKKKKGREKKAGGKNQKKLSDDDEAKGAKVKSKKGKGKTVTVVKRPLSESGTEEEPDEFRDEEAYED